MIPRPPLVLAFCVLLPAAGLAAPEAVPPPSGPRTVSVEFHGTLRDALKKIATEGGLNLIITGTLDEPTEVMLHGASAEEALATVARLHHLEVERQGGIWTVRRMNPGEQAKVESAAEEREQAEDQDEDEAATATPTPPTLPPVPTLPTLPVPPPPPGASAEISKHMEKLEHAQEKLRRKQERLQRKMHKLGQDHGLSGTGSVTVGEGQTVDDAVAFGGSLTVKGHVEGDAVAFGGNVHLAKTAVVDGDVTAFGGEVIREEGAEVGGDVNNFSGGGVGAVIADTVKHVNPEHAESHSFLWGFPGFLIRFALLFGVGFLALMFAPHRMKQLEDALTREPTRCSLVGLLGALALIPLILLLTVSCIGIPLVAVLGVLLPLGMAMGLCAIANVIGLRLPILRGRKTQALVLAIGLFILLLVFQIPVLGWLVLIELSFMSLGALIRTRFGNRRQQGIPEPA